MGLKGKDHLVNSLGITIPDAYAQAKEVHLRGVTCSVVFHIQKDRESFASYAPLEKIPLSFRADRSKSLLEQAYLKAKETLFEGWEDDIVTEEEVAPDVETEVAEE